MMYLTHIRKIGIRICLFVLIFIGLFPSCEYRRSERDPRSKAVVLKQKDLILPDRYNVAFLVTNGVYNTELTAPYDVFQHTQYRENIKAMNVFTVANTHELVRTFEGLYIKPDFDYTRDKLPKIDILVVPGAEGHMTDGLKDTTLINWVRETGTNAMFVTSHCDGVFLLAKAGLLDGISCTTFPADIKLFKDRFPQLRVYDNVVFVHDKNVITSTGGASSFDAVLYLIQILYGKAVADKIAKGLVIDWDLNKVRKVVIHQGNGYSTL